MKQNKFYHKGHFPQGRIKQFLSIFILASLILILCGGLAEMQKVTSRIQTFTVSARELRNPNRGFYHMYAFTIADEAEDYTTLVKKYCLWHPDPALAMVEVNLQNYRNGEISPVGLRNIDALLDAWSQSGKRLILRFLYDWEGKNSLYEPDDLETIVRHITQIGPILLRYTDTVFTLQGLFIGNWGEMHDTKFDSEDDLRTLAQALAQSTGSMYLSVRTPAQWRSITQQGADREIAVRMGLFNDGILGSRTDLGTYDMAKQGNQRRTRDAELDFQEELCASVPNGGEVVSGNTGYSFENAVERLAAMHITYLNWEYDREVLDQWAAVTVSGRGCFDGLDGLSYIRCRLGYRLLIDKAEVSYKLFQKRLHVAVSFQNAGFAPLYVPPEVTLVLQKGEAGPVLSYPMDHNLLELSGGLNTDKIGVAQAGIPLEELEEGTYRLYLDLKDPASGLPILLANKQDREESGYFLGTVTLQ